MIRVKLKNGTVEDHKDYEDGCWLNAEPNRNGDLVIYRNHSNMLSPHPIVSYAAGEWSAMHTVEDEQ